MRDYRGSLGALFVLAAFTVGGPAAAEVPYVWEGFYIGGQGGHSFEDGELDVTSSAKLTTVRGFGTQIREDFEKDSDEDGGGFGGGHLGYNFQSGHFVWGVEADINASDIKLGSASASSFAPRPDEGQFAAGTTTASAEIDWYGTVRGRLGVVKGPMLFYATGGLAYGEIDISGRVNLSAELGDDDPPGIRTASAVLRASTPELGWTAGAGFDYAFSPSIIFGISYQYVDLGDVSDKESLTTLRALGGSGFFSRADVDGLADVDASFHTVQARLSFKFGGREHYAPSEALK